MFRKPSFLDSFTCTVASVLRVEDVHGHTCKRVRLNQGRSVRMASKVKRRGTVMQEIFAGGKTLPFDTAAILDLGEIISLAQAATEKDRRKNGLIHLKTLIRLNNWLKAPFTVCDYFSVPYNIQRDGEHIWEKVEDIKMQVFMELGNLIDDGNDYLCDFDDDGSFAIFMRQQK